MKVVSNNTEINKCKEVMGSLMLCIQDKNTSKEDSTFYLKEYYSLSVNLIIMSKEN